MHTRRATIADLETLLDFERHFPTDRLSRDNLDYLLRRAHADTWVCAEAATVAGAIIVLYRRRAPGARVYSIAVNPAHRGRGIGRVLLAAAETGARARGCDSMGLEVRPDNQSAVRLYEKCGYRRIGRRERFFEDGSPALKMHKSIAVPPITQFDAAFAVTSNANLTG